MARPTDVPFLTIAQATSLHAKHARLPADCPLTFAEFLDLVMPVFGGDGAVTVPWCGMNLCIERDGYTHT